MGGYADRNINMQDAGFLHWFEQERQIGEEYSFSPRQSVLAMGLQELAVRYKVAPSVTIDVFTGVRRRYALYKNREFRQEFTLDMPVVNTFEATVNIRLYVATLSPDIRADLIKAFETFTVTDDIDKTCQALLAKHNITAADFYLEFFPTCRLISVVVDDRQEKKLDDTYQSRPSPILVIGSGEDNLETLGYYLQKRDYIRLLEAPSPTKFSDGIVRHPGMSDGEIEYLVREAAEREAVRHDCDPEYTDVIKVASMTGFPESKTVVEWKLTGSAGCRFHFWQSTTYWRDVDYVLYVTVTYRELDKRFAKTIKECARDAAIEGAILGLALESFELAQAHFISRFKALIYERTSQIFDCLIPKIRAATEYGEWH